MNYYQFGTDVDVVVDSSQVQVCCYNWCSSSHGCVAMVIVARHGCSARCS